VYCCSNSVELEQLCPLGMSFLEPCHPHHEDNPLDDSTSEETPAVRTRPRTAQVASNARPVSAAARLKSAVRPQSARAGQLPHNTKPETWLPAGQKSISRNAIPHRPATAGACGPPSRHATLARLKAELAAVAAGGNMQLQSLSPSAGPVDASAELQAQVTMACTCMLSMIHI
jgi:hypothetical protein